MTQDHYKLLYRLDGAERFLLWFTNERDGVVTDDAGFVPSFATEAALLAFAKSERIQVSEESPTLHNLDLVRDWLADPGQEAFDCVAVLNAWNLFGDVARSAPASAAPFSEADAKLRAVYDKVFFGNNLPAVTPEEEAYHPVWSSAEIVGLAALLSRGLELFRRATGDAV